MAKNVAEKVWKAVRKVVKAPWEITGPASSPEYVNELSPMERHKFAPATPPVKPSTPGSDPNRIYDIKYYTRDMRREPREKIEMDYDPNDPAQVQMMSEKIDNMPLPRFWVMRKKLSIDQFGEGHADDGGYQK